MIIIACSDRKSRHVTRGTPEEIYAGSLFRLSVHYAKRVGSRWCVLSAEYGLVAPDQQIDTYNRRMDRERAAVFRRTLAWPEQASVIAGNLYVSAMPDHYVRLISPGRVGEMMQSIRGLMGGHADTAPGVVNHIAKYCQERPHTKAELYDRLSADFGAMPGMKITINCQLLESRGLHLRYGMQWRVTGSKHDKTYHLVPLNNPEE